MLDAEPALPENASVSVLCRLPKSQNFQRVVANDAAVSTRWRLWRLFGMTAFLTTWFIGEGKSIAGELAGLREEVAALRKVIENRRMLLGEEE